MPSISPISVVVAGLLVNTSLDSSQTTVLEIPLRSAWYLREQVPCNLRADQRNLPLAYRVKAQDGQAEIDPNRIAVRQRC